MSVNKYVDKVEDFKGKKILITGATSGIGLELTKHLLYKHAHIVMLARNIDKANGIKAALLNTFPSAEIDIVKYDQANYEIIDSAVKEILDKHSDFYALVANAGILHPEKNELSVQGNPLTIDTNYLGLRRFLDQIIMTCHYKKVILQGSLAAGLVSGKKIDILNGNYPLFKQYNISKACVEALWYKYGTNNGDNEFILTEPGLAATDIIRGLNRVIRFLGRIYLLVFSHSSSKASLTLLKALETSSHNFDYYVPRGPFTMFGYPKKKKFPKKRQKEYLIKY